MPLQCNVVAPLQRVVTSLHPLQRVNQCAPSMRCLSHPFNAKSSRPFTALFRHCAPSTRHYVVAPLQRVVRCTPSTHCSTRPFNASLDVPLQRIVQCAHSMRCLMCPFKATSSRTFNATSSHPFNALSDGTLQHVVVACLFFFNASFDVPFDVLTPRTIQHVVVTCPSARRCARLCNASLLAPLCSLLVRPFTLC